MSQTESSKLLKITS